MRDHDALLAAIAARSRLPFSWRSNCCVRFAVACVRAQTGRTFLAGLQWRTLAGARRTLERLGGMEAAVDARLARIPPALAARGDVAGVPDPVFGIALMIVEGVTLVGPGEKGALRLPRSAMTCAWSAERSEA